MKKKKMTDRKAPASRDAEKQLLTPEVMVHIADLLERDEEAFAEQCARYRRRVRAGGVAICLAVVSGLAVWLMPRDARDAAAPLVARSEAVPAQRAEVLPPQEEASTARKEAAVPAKAMPAAQPLSELPPEAETATGTSAASAAAEPAEPIAADPSLLADNADMHPDAPTAQINVLCNQDACSSQGYSWIAYESIFKS